MHVQHLNVVLQPLCVSITIGTAVGGVLELATGPVIDECCGTQGDELQVLCAAVEVRGSVRSPFT